MPEKWVSPLSVSPLATAAVFTVAAVTLGSILTSQRLRRIVGRICGCPIALLKWCCGCRDASKRARRAKNRQWWQRIIRGARRPDASCDACLGHGHHERDCAGLQGLQQASQSFAVVVLGDHGRSPRMQNHLLCIAHWITEAHKTAADDFARIIRANLSGGESGSVSREPTTAATLTDSEVDRHLMRLKTDGRLAAIPRVYFIGYAESQCNIEVRNHPAVRIVDVKKPAIGSYRHFFKGIFAIVFACLKAAGLTWSLAKALWATEDVAVVLVQSPPAVPTLPTVKLFCFLRRAKMVVDWHNYGYSILGLWLGMNNILVKLYRWIEFSFGRRADAYFCVSKAMRKDLIQNHGIHSEDIHVLYDCASDLFRPISLRERHIMALKYLARDGLSATPVACLDDVSFCPPVKPIHKTVLPHRGGNDTAETSTGRYKRAKLSSPIARDLVYNVPVFSPRARRQVEILKASAASTAQDRSWDDETSEARMGDALLGIECSHCVLSMPRVSASSKPRTMGDNFGDLTSRSSPSRIGDDQWILQETTPITEMAVNAIGVARLNATVKPATHTGSCLVPGGLDTLSEFVASPSNNFPSSDLLDRVGVRPTLRDVWRLETDAYLLPSEVRWFTRRRRPAVIVTSTSWTPDENLDMLLDAIKMYDDWVTRLKRSELPRSQGSGLGHHETAELKALPPNIILIVTGKGPMRESWMGRAADMGLRQVAIRTVFTPPEDYPRFDECSYL
eukprot:Selendium_serpulae@DN6354_c0_g2_i1.p1